MSRLIFQMQDTWTLRPRLMLIASGKARRSSGPESTRSPSGACAQMGAVDCISEHRTTLIKEQSWHIVGRHADTSGLSDNDPTSERKWDHGPALWATIPSISINQWCRSHRADGRSAFLAGISLKPPMYSLFVS